MARYGGEGLALRTLGRTGLQVTPLCVGSVPLGNTPLAYEQDVPLEDALATVRRVLEGPVNFLDTSNNYGDAEHRIGIVLRELGGIPDGFVLETKVDRDMDERRLLRRARAPVGRGEPGAARARPARARALPRPGAHLLRGGRRAGRPARDAATAQGRGRDRAPRRRGRPDRPHAALHPHRRVRRRAHPQPLHADRPVRRAAARRGGRARRRRAQRRAVRRRHPGRLDSRAGPLRLPAGEPRDPGPDRATPRRVRPPRRPARRRRAAVPDARAAHHRHAGRVRHAR